MRGLSGRVSGRVEWELSGRVSGRVSERVKWEGEGRG